MWSQRSAASADTLPQSAYAMQSQDLQSDLYLRLSRRAAALVREEIERNPALRLGLPTGRTPTGCYEILAGWSRAEELDWSGVYCFGLDEYIEGPEADSFRRYLYEHIYKHTNILESSRFNPLFHDDYDGLIARLGGLDLTLLGIGTNGHIAFNEPGTPLDSWTHCVSLTPETIAANKPYFSDPENLPRHAVTMGIRTILSSKRIVLLASGESKKAITHQALTGPVTPDVPASFLQLHDNIDVVTDFQ